MKDIIQLINIFQGSGLLVTSFTIGAIALFIAIVGQVNKNGIDLPLKRSILLGVFGIILILFAISGSFAAPTNSPLPVSTTRSEMDALFGKGNWFCFPDRDDGIAVKRIPQDFLVVSPIRLIVTYRGEFLPGESIPEIGATVELEYPLPQTNCPKNQLAALDEWKSASDLDRNPLTQVRVNAILGNSNWECVDEFPYAVKTTYLTNELAVSYPITFVTYFDSTGFGVGETVRSGQGATVWLSGNIPPEECPQRLSLENCMGSDWEDCWLFDDSAKTMTWIGPGSGTFDIGQEDTALEKIRAGYSAIFNINSPAFIETCSGTINGRTFSGYCPVIEYLPPGQYEVISSGDVGGFRVRSHETRERALYKYNLEYEQSGWCPLWNQLINDGLVKGLCPQTVGNMFREEIDDESGSSENLPTGIQLAINSDIEVIYPACINYGIDEDYAKILGGHAQPWTENSNIATNVNVLSGSVFSLYFRCDHISWNNIFVPGYQETGVQFSVKETGTHVITITGGAYSPWPSDNYAGNQGWLSQLYIYRNRPIAWGLGETGLIGPIDPDFIIGYGDFEITRSAAEAKAIDMSVIADLVAGDLLTFVPIDERGAYTSPAKNRGEVVINVLNE
jgi:hypothetical protein